MKPLTALCLLPLLGSQAMPVAPAVDERVPCVLAPEAAPALGGPWTLTWDDSTDLALDRRNKACRLALTEVHGTLVGRFDGPVLGEERAAVFTGEALPGGPRPLVSLVQREPGYSCAYLLTRESATRLVGTWRDSRGGGGTAELVRRQPAEDRIELIEAHLER